MLPPFEAAGLVLRWHLGCLLGSLFSCLVNVTNTFDVLSTLDKFI